MSFNRKDNFFWQNRHHCAVYCLPIQRSENEVDGQATSILEPIELCKALRRDLVVSTSLREMLNAYKRSRDVVDGSHAYS